MMAYWKVAGQPWVHARGPRPAARAAPTRPDNLSNRMPRSGAAQAVTRVTELPRRSAGRRAVITGPSCRWQRGDPVFVHHAGGMTAKAVPVAPRAAPGPIVQDRNMALTWSNGAPGRIRTRDPLLRRHIPAVARGGQVWPDVRFSCAMEADCGLV